MAEIWLVFVDAQVWQTNSLATLTGGDRDTVVLESSSQISQIFLAKSILLPNLILTNAILLELVGLLITIHVRIDRRYSVQTVAKSHTRDHLRKTGFGHEGHITESIFEERAADLVCKVKEPVALVETDCGK